MIDFDLCWRAEDACLNAWPAERTLNLGGFLARFSGGSTRRTNSLNPLRAAPFDPGRVLAEAHALYAAAGQPLIVRIPDIAFGLEEALPHSEFDPAEGEALTLMAPLDATPAPRGAETGALSEAWLAGREALTGVAGADAAIFRRMTSLITAPAVFASARHEDRIAAVAYGAISRGLVVIESVVTAADLRGLGFGRRVVGAVMAWGRQEGARAACLQVLASNDPALSLYRRLGFNRELYRYRFRRARRAGLDAAATDGVAVAAPTR